MADNNEGLLRFNIIQSVTSDPLNLINSKINTTKYKYLLSYHLDGVVWGIIESKELKISSEYFKQESTEFIKDTLLQAHLFGSSTELYIWKDERIWRTRELIERPDGEISMRSFEEKFILWGTSIETQKEVFSRVSEGQRGIIHTPPLKPEINDFKPYSMRLLVRHYLDFDENGVAQIAFSRLVDLLD